MDVADETEDLKQQLEDYKAGAAPEMRALVTWDKDLVFTGRTQRGETIDFDGRVEWGCMPTESLLLSIGACLAIDVVSFVTKMRAEITGFKMEIRGSRNPRPPQYFTAVDLMITVTGKNITDNKMKRAISLSKEKYCSVYHTLRPDLKHTVSYEIVSED